MVKYIQAMATIVSCLVKCANVGRYAIAIVRALVDFLKPHPCGNPQGKKRLGLRTQEVNQRIA